MWQNDQRIVMTLDAGGTNFVFTAIQQGEEIVTPIQYSVCVNDLDSCLGQLIDGFKAVKEQLTAAPSAISFAFPGPADYSAGIIGDLPNFPCFRGGVALGPLLSDVFQLPVYINNDGNLFAYGEAVGGALPYINQRLQSSGSTKSYQNLLGITLGTGFGGGVVLNGRLLTGDNECGGDVWCMRNKRYPRCIAEESVSIRAVTRSYNEQTGELTNYTPKEIFEIAEGLLPGDPSAAKESFRQLGEVVGDAIAAAITIIDGLVVIGGGLSGAQKYILPALVAELNSALENLKGDTFSRLQMKAYNLNDAIQKKSFLSNQSSQIKVPYSNRMVTYDPCKRIGVLTSQQGTNRSVAVGAYCYALAQLDKREIDLFHQENQSEIDFESILN